MHKKPIAGILLIALLAVVLFMNYASAPSPESRVEIKDKQDDHIFVVPGTQFCVERTLRNKDTEKISPVIVPLFSEGATLESIDVKRVTEETYMEDVADYGTCQRTVSKTVDLGKGECTGQWTENNTCLADVEEDYSCITGYHKEQRTREAITYEPVLQGQYRDGEDDSEDEYRAEIFRSALPDDVKALENIGYSNEFDLEDEATVRMCFRAPEWGSEITSGQISYLTYYGSGYDYESSTGWDFYEYRRNISCTNMDDRVPLVINGSGGFCGGSQIVWTYCSGTGTALYYDSCSDYVVWNDTTQLPMDVEVGNSSSFTPTVPWGNAKFVYHLNQTANDSSSSNNDGVAEGDPTPINNGLFGGGYAFDGDDALNSNYDYNEANSYTYCGWYNTSITPNYEVFFGWYEGTASNKGVLFRIKDDTTSVQLASGYDDGGKFQSFTVGTVNDQGWKYVCVVHNLTDTNTLVYWNGTFIGDHSYNPVATTYDVIVASQSSGNPACWEGSVDEVRFYEEIKTTDWIEQTYKNALGYPGYGDLGAEETNEGGGGSSGNGSVINTAENLILSPGSGTTEVNGSLDVSGDFLWIDNNVCASGTAVQNITASGTLECVSVSGGGGGGNSSEEMQDAVMDAIDGGTQTGITVTYQDESNDMDFEVTLGTSIETGEITDNTILEADFSCTNSPTDNYVLSYDSGSGGFTWVEDATGTGGNSTEEMQDACGAMAGSHLTYTDGSNDLSVDDDWVDIDGDTMTGDLNIDGQHYIKFNGNYAFKRSASSNVLDIDPTNDFDRTRIHGKLTSFGNITPEYFNNTNSLGESALWWKEGYITTLHQGDLREYYIENPDYEYEIGDVVAMDLDSEYEIRPLMDLSDRLIGVVAGLPHDETADICDEEGCHEETIHIDTDVAIYGKYHSVKVKGTIRVGDYLVASDEPGVVTSMYDKEHPMFESSALKKPKSTKKNEYNQLAKMLPTLGIAMEEYDSDEVGTIKVVLGK